MAGQIKRRIDQIIEARSKGNSAVAMLVRSRLALKGIDPDKYTAASPDDPAVLAKLDQVAAEYGLSVKA